MKSKNVRIWGQVVPPDHFFISTDIVLVPTPIELGIRVRILTAFAFKCCVVAHSSNQLGIPEMRHMDNAILGSSGTALVDLIAGIAFNKKHRNSIAVRARRTYLSTFSIDSAGQELNREMTDLYINTRS